MVEGFCHLATAGFAALLISLLYLRFFTRIDHCPAGYQFLCEYRPDFLRVGKHRYKVYGRRCWRVRRLVRRRLRSKVFRLKMLASHLLPARKGGGIGWERFRATMLLRRLRPEMFGILGGFAGPVTPAPAASLAGAELRRMVVGIETWIVKIPFVRGSVIDHEMVHAAQEAHSRWITLTREEPRETLI